MYEFTCQQINKRRRIITVLFRLLLMEIVVLYVVGRLTFVF